MGQEIQKECTRCGTCCAKGGPALHKSDLELYAKGIFQRKDLMTFRRGELVRNNVTGQLEPLQQELVKITRRNESTWTCCFFNVVDRLCFIYNDRPEECKTLDCWNPDALQEMYEENRITRLDVLGDNNGYAELVRMHEEKCGYEYLGTIFERMKEDPSAREEFLESVRFDMAFRKVVQEKAGVPSAEMEFLFGRTLGETVHMFGLRIVDTEHGPELEDIIEKKVS
jgi:Fe-S-cluster containining protein